jgi:transposase
MGFRYFLGIDVAKAKLDCLMLDSVEQRRRSKVVANTPEGFQHLVKWLTKQGVGCDEVHAILEPTGVYHERALLALTQAGIAVSLVNPAQLRRFAQGLGIHTKTDACDSAVLARFGEMIKPAHWQPAPSKARELRALLARRDAVSQDLQRERNRCEKLVIEDTPERVRQSLADAITFLERELQALQKSIDQHIDDDPDLKRIWDLLQSIPGVGQRVADHFTALLAGRDFKSAEQLAAYLGLVPAEWQSGTSIKGRPRMSKAGSASLRQLLYMPAVVATRHNPHVKALYQRLLAKGKAKMSAIGAAMHKLAHLCFGVVHSGQPYRADWSGRA